MNNISIKCLKSNSIKCLLWSILINSLQPGQGITIGNQLRRVLLGDLGGIAISAVRIVTHEFSTIPGVRRYTWNIIKFKRNCCKNKTQDIEFGRLKVPSVITADLIQLPSNLEIVNPNHYIATISTSFLKLNLSLNMVLVIG
jgi:DNA-directed RNA polymerase subunit alpha